MAGVVKADAYGLGAARVGPALRDALLAGAESLVNRMDLRVRREATRVAQEQVDLAREQVLWKTPFTRALDDSNAPFFRWFDDGTLNVSHNCLDRHLGTATEDKTAIVFEADDGTVDCYAADEL